jgi:hypothetical protein
MIVMRFNDLKILVERCLCISLQDLKPYLKADGFSGTISWGESNVNISLHHDVLTRSYHFSINDGPQTKIKSTFRLERVPRHFGGFMFYMRCPKCDRRIRVIYMRDGYWLCKKCHDLQYSSTRATDSDNFIRQSNKYARKLGLEGGWQYDHVSAEYGRPKWMHKTTFWLLQDKCRDYQLRAMMAALGVRGRAKILGEH